MASDFSDGKPDNARFWAVQIRGASGIAIMVLMLGGLLPVSASALPVDPQRPIEARTCKDAKARLYEALTGSPLISVEEMAEVLRVVRDRAEQLCGSEVTQEIVTKFHTDDIKKSK